jgi:hypothetical protein
MDVKKLELDSKTRDSIVMFLRSQVVTSTVGAGLVQISDILANLKEVKNEVLEKSPEEKTEEKLEVGQFINLARVNMNRGFEEKYGSDWRRIIHDSVPEDVSTESLYLWLSHNDGFEK